MTSSQINREKRGRLASSNEQDESKRLHSVELTEVHFVTSDSLKKIVDATWDVVKDVNFDFIPDVEGVNSYPISFQTMDSSHVALVSGRFKKTAFSHYRCDRAVTCGCNMSTLHKLLKPCSDTDILRLNLSSDSDDLKMNTQNATNTKRREYNIPLIDIDCEHLCIPGSEYSAKVHMTAKMFKQTIGECADAGPDVTIACNKQGITFSTKGDNCSVKLFHAARVSETEDDPSTVLMKLEDDVTQTFASKYLKSFCKLENDFVILHLKRGNPIYIKYSNEMFDLEFHCAPKIDEWDQSGSNE